MRWDAFRRSENVEDRRGDGSPGPGGLGPKAGGLGIGTIVVLGLIGWALGIDPRVLIGGAEILTGGGPSYQSPASDAPQPSTRTGTPDDQMGQFVAALLGETEDRWKEIFQSAGKTYQAPKLVMFSGITRSACGAAQSA